MIVRRRGQVVDGSLVAAIALAGVVGWSVLLYEAGRWLLEVLR